MIELPTIEDIRGVVRDTLDDRVEDIAAASRPVWMTITQYAEHLGVSEPVVRRMISGGRIIVMRCGPRTVRIHRETNDARLLQSHGEEL